jgi:Terminase-like family.
MALDPNDPSNFVKMDKWNYFDLIGYKPHPRQRLFHESTARFKVPICGRRFGKSVMAAREITPNLFLPNRRYWIVGPTYDLGEKEFRIIWNDLIIKLGLGRQREIKRSYSKKAGDLSIEFPWGTKLEVRSADRPDNLVGEGLHGVIMSEAAKHTEETWDRFIRPALTDFRGTALFPTTPEGQNWLYELWKMGRDPKFPDFESWQFPSWDNPIVYPLGKDDPEILLTKATTPEESFLQEYGADFTNFTGKIYKEWDEGTHVQSVPFVPGLPNYIAFDWGYTAPMAAVEFQIDTLGRVRVWREHYKSHTRLRDYLGELRNRPQPDGYHLDLCFGDAANPEAVVTVSEDFCPCYADPRSKSGTYGGTTSSGWMEGIELVKGCLKMQEVDQDEFGTPIEQPWLIVDHSCVNTIREFNNYRSIAAVRGKDPREAAHASDDHALDALRYGLMHYFKLGATASLASVIDTETMLLDLPDRGYFTSGKNFA